MYAIIVSAMEWVIEYYVTDNGKYPVKDFVDSLSPVGKAKYIFISDLLEQYGIAVREPYVKAIKGKRKLFEMRIKDKSNIHRIIYFVYTGKTLILLHGFTKKTQRTPAKEIRIAETRMKDYLTRTGGST